MHRTLSCLAVGLIATLATLPKQPATAGDPSDLLGKPFAAAFTRLGVPAEGSGTAGCVTWLWRDDGSGYVRICTHEGLVVHVDTSHKKGELTVKTAPATGFYPGQPVAELLERLGNPLRAGAAMAPADAGPGASQRPAAGPMVAVADALLVYPDARLYVAAGRVLGAAPEPAPARGPR